MTSRQSSRQPTPGPTEFQVNPPQPRTFERQAWDSLVVEQWGVKEGNAALLTNEQFVQWETYRNRYVAEEREKLARLARREEKRPERTLSTSGAMTTTDKNKLFRQIVSDPGDFDGNRIKFEAWWNNMQIYLMGYAGVDDIARVMAVLSRFKTGEAEAWARIKKQEIIRSAGADWTTFSQELQERFEDVSKIQKARNDIHNFHQGNVSADAFIDQFEILKAESGTNDDTAYYLLTRGISKIVLDKLYGSKEKVPTTYRELVPAIRAIGQNIDIVHGLLQSVSHPGRRQSHAISRGDMDTRTHSGVIHGGSGKPMEIDRVSITCFNCGKEGHMSRNCYKPKKAKEGLKCFKCGQEGHFSRECNKKKKPILGELGKERKKKEFRKCIRECMQEEEDDSEISSDDDDNDDERRPAIRSMEDEE